MPDGNASSGFEEAALVAQAQGVDPEALMVLLSHHAPAVRRTRADQIPQRRQARVAEEDVV